MALFKCRHPLANAFMGTFIAVSMANISANPQIPQPPSQPSGAPSSQRHDSIEVTVHLSAEDVEDGKLNDVYQDVYQSVAQLQRKTACTPEIIRRYESEVIAPAEKSSFDVPRNKFLFLANRDIGNCYLAQQKFWEAEAAFQKILQYAPVWPGTSDSAYPIDFRQIAEAQMGLQRWAAAEQSLLKSIALFDPQIARGEKLDAELQSNFSLNYRGSQSRSSAMLAVVYFREGRTQDALKTVEKAYEEVTKYNLAPQYRSEVESIGKAIAEASGDLAAQQLWSQRKAAM